MSDPFLDRMANRVIDDVLRLGPDSIGEIVVWWTVMLLTVWLLLGVWLWLAAALFVMGFTYGPLGGFIPDLFPAGVRYTAVSLAFSMGGIIGGALTPYCAAALAKADGLWAVGMLLVAAGVLSLIGLAMSRRTSASR